MTTRIFEAPTFDAAEEARQMEISRELTLAAGGAYRGNGHDHEASHDDGVAGTDDGSMPSGMLPPEAHRANGQPQSKPTSAPPRFTNIITSAELLALDCRIDFLVEDVLVKGQPGVFGGRSKTLKTSTIIDLALSLGSGTPFLGTFPSRRATVAYWSGESGAATVKSKAIATAAAKGIELSEASVFWSFDLPKLVRSDHLLAMAELIERRKIDVAIIDPLYLSLLDPSTAGQAGNIYAMGAALQPLTELTQPSGCTILLAHHFKRSAQSDPDEPAALEELSQSGIVEWARQWCLLARRSPYQGDGQHELWLRCGGSAGHAGLYSYNVNEGSFDPEQSRWRKWDVAVSQADAREAVKQDRDRRKIEKQAAQDSDDCRRLLESLRRFAPDGETLRTVREAAGLNGVRVGTAIRALMRDGMAEAIQFKKNGRSENGYRATE